MPNSTTRVHVSDSFPHVSHFGADAVVIYDRKLRQAVPGFEPWIKSFPRAYAVTSGESLKDIAHFPTHVARLTKLTADLSARRLTIVAVGGGSVGDFAGFVASVFKRGVRLVHVPTTWLAAIDSSHGGKTALNVGGFKNQIGTFYPAAEVRFVKKILLAQPEARAHEGCGELGKIALIDGGAWVKELEKSKAGTDPARLLWTHLDEAVEAKLRVVAKDPREQSGYRQILNLGHTLGHVLEAAMGLAHGEAVGQGLFFALGWSFTRGTLSLKDHGRARYLLENVLGLSPLVTTASYKRRRPTAARARQLLLQDKKRDSRGDVTFIFLEAFGRPLRESVSIDALIEAASEQGWLK